MSIYQPLIDEILAGARGNMLEHGEVAPMCFFAFTDGRVNIRPPVPPRFRDIEDTMYRIAAKYEECDAVFLLNEAWTLERDEKEPYIQPSKSERRKEHIVVEGKDKDGTSYCIMQEILRVDGDKIEFGEPRALPMNAKSYSRRLDKCFT